MLKVIRKIREQRGSAILEFAVAVPVLVYLALGATDFGRVFYESIAVAGAAAASVQYGSSSHLKSDDFGGMEAAALADAEDLTGVTATPERFCDCPNNPGVSVSCLTGDCGTYGLPRMYVRARVQKPFQTLAPYPNIPRSLTIDLDSWMRLQ